MSEPWLSGPLAGINAVLAPLFHSFEQVRHELAAHTKGLTAEQLWSKPQGLTPAGFHIRHLGGAADRLSTYLAGGQLSEEQMQAMQAESNPGASCEELLAELDQALARCEARVRAVDPSSIRDPREVGRKKLPTTVQGLLVHIAEHSQRHLGQAITTIKLIRTSG